MILLIDNYDSFVYNLARYVTELGKTCVVKRNDAITLSEIHALKPSHIILSPGPCTPNEAGICLDIVQSCKTTPILGVCLGHQTIGQAFGATITKARNPTHGKARDITHQASGLFQDLQSPLKVGRYHSLIVSEDNFPDCLEITARCLEGEIMALQHKHYPIFGVQFHPESILTDGGYEILSRFLRS